MHLSEKRKLLTPEKLERKLLTDGDGRTDMANTICPSNDGCIKKECPCCNFA